MVNMWHRGYGDGLPRSRLLRRPPESEQLGSGGLCKAEIIVEGVPSAGAVEGLYILRARC